MPIACHKNGADPSTWDSKFHQSHALLLVPCLAQQPAAIACVVKADACTETAACSSCCTSAHGTTLVLSALLFTLYVG